MSQSNHISKNHKDQRLVDSLNDYILNLPIAQSTQLRLKSETTVRLMTWMSVLPQPVQTPPTISTILKSTPKLESHLNPFILQIIGSASLPEDGNVVVRTKDGDCPIGDIGIEYLVPLLGQFINVTDNYSDRDDHVQYILCISAHPDVVDSQYTVSTSFRIERSTHYRRLTIRIEPDANGVQARISNQVGETGSTMSRNYCLLTSQSVKLYERVNDPLSFSNAAIMGTMKISRDPTADSWIITVHEINHDLVKM